MNIDALVSDSAPLGSRTPLERLACYGSTPIRVRGYFPQIPADAGLGGACGPASPVSWLICQNINYNGLVASESAGFSSPWLKVTINPATGVTMPPRGQWVEVVGHLDDPAARNCAPSTMRVFGDVLTCRTDFVVESVSPVAGPY